MVTEVEMNRKSALPSKDNALRFFRFILVATLNRKLACVLKSTQMRNRKGHAFSREYAVSRVSELFCCLKFGGKLRARSLVWRDQPSLGSFSRVPLL